jgi:hypothetical protein
MDLKEAAKQNLTVNFKLLYWEEKTLGLKSTPALQLGLKCETTAGQEITGWLRHTIWGTDKSAFFTQMFIDSLDRPVEIKYEDESWLYDEKEIKFRHGLCKLKLNDRGYPQVDTWVESGKEIMEELVERKDDDIPF